MNYEYKYKYKYKKYLRKNMQIGGANDKKCYLTKDDMFVFGHGGSSSIIVLTRDERVYKFILIQYYEDNLHKNHYIDNENKNSDNEVAITKLMNKISPHFIKLYDSYKCNDSTKLFSLCGNDVFTYLKNKNNHPICHDFFQNYPVKKYISTYNVMELEYCKFTCASYLEHVATLDPPQIKSLLDKLIFQIAWSLHAAQHTYKYFIHHDLFIRNILGTPINHPTKHIRYKTKTHTFDVPATDFFPKIIDFGRANLDETHHNQITILMECPYKDLFTFTYDIYNGQNHGSFNLTTLITQQNNPKKLSFLNNYFSTFFDTNKLSAFTNSDYIPSNWEISISPKFQKLANLKTPTQILESYFNKIFEPQKDHEIFDEFTI